ncbi:MAG: hypothetical protein KIS92_20035 [Planctomycetota bacterium]|nr:hypothetical protein [Planctomycetota bacterium]
MRKLEELANPQSCLNKAKDDEWLFVLLGRDVAAPQAVRAWIDERIRTGKNLRSDKQIIEAERWIVHAIMARGVSVNNLTPQTEERTTDMRKVRVKIEGVSGVGKTALMHCLALYLERCGVQVTCQEGDEGPEEKAQPILLADMIEPMQVEFQTVQ